MKTYIVKEQAFAGSVTIGVQVYGIRAETFEDAARQLAEIVESQGGSVEIDSDCLRYRFSSSSGQMDNKELKILTPPPTPARQGR